MRFRGKVGFAAVLMTMVAAIAMALPDIPIPADIYDGDGTRDRVTALEDGTGLGASTNSGVTVAEAASSVAETIITLDGLTLIATDGSDEGESLKVFDCDAGMFTLLGAIADLTVVSTAGATNTFVMGFGTAAAGDDNALTSTEADVIPSTSIDTTAGTVLTNAFDAVLAAAIVMNGTSAAKALYLNLAIDDDNMDADVTNTVSGTITLLTTKVRDN